MLNDPLFSGILSLAGVFSDLLCFWIAAGSGLGLKTVIANKGRGVQRFLTKSQNLYVGSFAGSTSKNRNQ
jgi:hypothetical protein